MQAPENLNGYRADLERGLKLIDTKHDGYAKGQQYYDGTRAEVAASKVVESIIAASAAAHPIGLAHIPVDTVANKVELASVTAAEDGPSAALTAIMDNNDLGDEFDDWLVKACYFGDYYGIVDPRDEDEAGNAAAETLRIVGSSPLNTIVIYDESDQRTALYGLKRWQDKGKRWHARLYYDDVTVKLSTPADTSAAKAESFELDLGEGGEDGAERIAHTGSRMLIEHLPVGGKPYGTPIHAKAFGPQDAITKISATNLVNVDGQGFASRWALADPLAELDDDIDDDFGTDGGAAATDPDGMTRATTGTSRVRSIPGSIALLKGITKVGQFDQTKSADFLTNLDWYVRVMAVATGVPLFEFDLTGEQPSGESRRRAEGRVNRTARKVQNSAGSFLKNLADTILAALGTAGVVSVAFYPLETSTDKDGLELVGLKVKSGVPVRVALLEAGYTTEQVDGWWPEKEPAVTMDMLAIIGSALAALGNARTLGVVTDVEVRGMLPSILTEARGEGGISPVVPAPVAAPKPPAAASG